MVEFLFCMMSLFFMAWVVVLKLREDSLRKEIAALQAELETRPKQRKRKRQTSASLDAADGVEVSSGVSGFWER